MRSFPSVRARLGAALCALPLAAMSGDGCGCEGRPGLTPVSGVLDESATEVDAVTVRLTQGALDFIGDQVGPLLAARAGAGADGLLRFALPDLDLPVDVPVVGTVVLHLRALEAALQLGPLRLALLPDAPGVSLQLEDARIGIDALLRDIDLPFGADAACALRNGFLRDEPDGYSVALEATLAVTVAGEAHGGLSVTVSVPEATVRAFGVHVETDCSLAPECTDGCGECESVCGAADLALSLGDTVRGLVEERVRAEIAPRVQAAVDAVLSGLGEHPLRAEVRIDPLALLGGALPGIREAAPLTALVVGQERSTRREAAGATQALALTLDGTVASDDVASCVWPLGEPPAPPRDGEPGAEAARGSHLSLTVGGALVTSAARALHDSGVLCLEVDAEALARAAAPEAMGGAARGLDTKVLQTVVPELGVLTPDRAPIALRITPSRAPEARFGDIDDPEAPTATLTVPEAWVDVHALVDGALVRLFGLRADLVLALGVTPRAGGLTLQVTKVALERVEGVYAELVQSPAEGGLIPALVQSTAGALSERSFDIELPLAGVLEQLTGVPAELSIDGIGAVGDEGRDLTVRLSVRAANEEGTR